MAEPVKFLPHGVASFYVKVGYGISCKAALAGGPCFRDTIPNRGAFRVLQIGGRQAPETVASDAYLVRLG